MHLFFRNAFHRNAGRRLWRLGMGATVTLLLLLLAYGVTTWSAQARTPQGTIDQIWQRVREVGAYEFTADITQEVVPVASITNIGRSSQRQDLHIQGSTNLRAQEMVMTLWSQGGNVLDRASGLELKTAQGRLLARKGGSDWQEINNFTDAIMPQADFTTFLAGATNIKVVNDGTTGQAHRHYSYDIDGATFAAYLRTQVARQMTQRGELPPNANLELPPSFAQLRGSGELWVSADGLPLRQLANLRFPEQDGQWVNAILDVTFRFDKEVVADQQKPLANLQRAMQDPGHPVWQTVLLLATLVLSSGLTVLFVVRRRSALVYKALSTVVILAMVGGPLAQTAYAEGAYKRHEARQQEQQALQDQAELMEKGSQEAGLAESAPPTQETLALIRNDNGANHDGDQWSDLQESLLGANPLKAESGALDQENTLAAVQLQTTDPAKDSDGDTLTDAEEALLGTNPERADTDSDTLTDAQEIGGFTHAGRTWYTDPRAPDTNRDSLSDLEEWNSPGSLHTTWDTDNDGEPDLLDRDNDGDGVPDALDVSPFRTWTTTFTAANPFALVVDGLAAGKPTFVEVQLRPTNPDHLWYALNAMDWPADNGGNLRDLNNSPDDLKLIPMIEVLIPSSPYNLPVATARVGLTIGSSARFDSPPITGTVELTQVGNDIDVEANLTDPAFLEIWQGTCDALEGRASSRVTVAGLQSGQTLALDDFTNLKLRDRATGGFVLLVTGTGFNGCEPLPQLSFDGDQMIDTAQLEPYGISIREAAADRVGKLLYVPLNLVTDDPANLNGNSNLPATQTPRGGRVAFSANIPYSAAGSWPAAHQMRMVWTVQMLTDQECPDGANCSDYYDLPTVVHTYDDQWTLTGVDVREENGVNLAIIYEDPTVDSDLNDDIHTAELAAALEYNFLAGRATGDQLDITVTELVRRVNRATNAGVTDDERWGIENVFNTESYSYPSLANMVRDSIDRANTILATKFTPLQGSNPNLTPLLLQAGENSYRVLNTNLEAKNDAVQWDISGRQLTMSFNVGNAAPLRTTASLRWQPYQFDTTSANWKNYEMAPFWQLLEQRYAADLADNSVDLHEGDLRLTQLLYLVLTNGLHQTVKVGDKPLIGQSKSDKEIRTALKGASAISKVVFFVPNKVLKARLNEGVKPLRDLFRIAYQKEVQGDWQLASEKIFGRLFSAVKNVNIYNFALIGGIIFSGVLLVTTWAISIANAFVKNRSLAITAAVLTIVSTGYFNVFIPILKGLNEVAKVGKTATILGLTDKLGSIKNAKIWGAVAAALTIGVAWGYFIYAVASGNVKPGSIAFGTLLAFTIATTIVALIFLAISQIPIFGQIIAGIIAIIDAILTIICEAGVKELRGVVDKRSDSCFTLSGALAEFLAAVIFQSDVIFDFEHDDFSTVLVPTDQRFPQVKAFRMELGRPTAGQVAGNTIQFSANVGGTFAPSKPKGDVTSLDFYETYGIDDTGIAAEFNTVKRDVVAPVIDPDAVVVIIDGNYWSFTPRVKVTAKGSGGFFFPIVPTSTEHWLYTATTPDYPVATGPITLTNPGINATYMTPIYLNIGMSIPAYGCVFRGGCSRQTPVAQSLSDKIIESNNFALDILPATIESFFARDWGKAAGGAIGFAPAPDFDGDGLRNTTAGGLDPNDAKYDTDADGLPDSYEFDYRALGVGKGGGQISATSKDTDNDGLCDGLELQIGSRPDLADTDNDGLADGVEVYHQNCTSGAWSGGWTFTYNTGKNLLITSDPKATDSDQDGMSDAAEKQLHELNPTLYPFRPDVFNTNPVGVLGYLSDGDRVVKPGDTVVYTGTVVNNIVSTLWATGTLQTAFPNGTSAAPRTDRFLLGPQGAQAFATTLTISGASQKDTAINHQVTAQLLTSQNTPSSGAPGLAFSENYLFSIDNDRPTSQLTSSQYVQAGGFRTIGGTATDPTSYVTGVEVQVVGQTGFAAATGAGAWAYVWQVPNDNRQVQIQSRATDAVGFVENPPASTTVLVDATPPNLTTGQPGNPILPAKRDAEYRWTLALNGTVNDPTIVGQPGSGVQAVEVLVEPRATGWQPATFTGSNWTIAYPLSPFDADNNRTNEATGQYTVTVRATDNVANRTAEANYLVYGVRVDTTPPTAVMLSYGDKVTTNGNNVLIEATSFITRNVVLTGTATDPGGFASSVQKLEIAFTPADLLDTLEAANTLYYLNEPQGISSYTDGSGSGANGSCTGNRCPVNDATGIYGSAVQFDGANDVITATTNISETDLTVSLWFNTTTANGGLFAATTGAVGSNADRSLYLVNGNVCAFVQGVQSDEICTAGQNYSDGQWHQAVLTLAPGAPFRLYVDGALGATAGVVSASTLTAQSGIALGYARTRNGANSYLNGRLDEVEIYPAGLNAIAVAALYRRWQPVTLASPGAATTTWSYQLPNDLEGLYQIDIRSQDVLGNRNDDERSRWRQWRGVIDTAAPRITLLANLDGFNSTLQTTYQIKAEDFQLTGDAYAGICPLQPDDYVYDTSPFWQRIGDGSPRVKAFDISCIRNDFPGSATATVCDIFGHCATASESRDMLYWSTVENGPDISDISRANLNGGYQRQELFSDGPRVTGLDVDQQRGQLYWLERNTATTGRIRRSDLDGANLTTINVSPAPAIDEATFPATFDLAVNGPGGKLYWSEENTIKWANLDGSAAATLFTLPTSADPTADRIGSIVVDSANGKIYFNAIDWLNAGDFLVASHDSQIWVMNADGTNPQVLVDFATLDNVVVIKLALSQDKSRLYWTQRLYLSDRPSAGNGFFYIPAAGGAPVAVNTPDANRVTFFSILEMSPEPAANPRYAYRSEVNVIRQVDLTTNAVGFFAAEPPFHIVGNSAIARVPGLTEDAGNLLAIDLELRRGSNVGAGIPGATINYPLTVRNNGPLGASNVAVVVNIPAGATFVAGGSSPACSSSGATQVTCTLAQLADAAQESLTVQVQISASAGSTLVPATASVSSNRSELKPANNSVTFDEVLVFAPATPAPNAARYLYWGYDNQLYRIKADGSATRWERVVSHLAFPDTRIVGVVADSLNGYVYFSTLPVGQNGVGAIHRIGLDSTGLTTIYTDNTSPWPTKLTLDVENNHLYFGAGDAIKRINLDGNGETTIVNNLPGVSAVAVNTLRDEIYWGDGAGRLMRASLTGANPTQILGDVQVDELAVDPHTDTIYYRIERPLVIYSIGRNGDGQTILVNGTGYTGPALDIGADSFYWIDGYVLGTILKYNLTGPFPVIRNNGATELGLAGAQIETQLALAYTDAALVPTPTATATDTPIPAATPTPLATPTAGGPPAADNLFWSNQGGEILRAPVAGCPDRSCVQAVVTPSPGASAGDLAIDSLRGKLYWVNPIDKRIQRANLDGSNPETILSGLTDPLGITLDETQGRLYWTDFTAGTIQSAGLDGSDVITVTSGLTNPVWIDFAPQQGALYFIQSAQSPSVQDNRLIRRIDTDGSNLVTLLEDDPRFGINFLVTGLTVNENLGRLYWSDAENQDAFFSSVKWLPLPDGDWETVVAGGANSFAYGVTSDRNSFKLYWSNNDNGLDETNIFVPGTSNTVVPDVIRRGFAEGERSGQTIDDLIVYVTPQPQTAPLKLALQYPSPTPATCPADSSEANNTPATATTLTVGSALTNRNFHTAADEDWYVVALSGGLRYRLSAAVAAGSDADPLLELYASDGVTLLASNDNVAADQRDSELTVDAPINGNFYLRVSNLPVTVAQLCNTAYGVAVTEVAIDPTVADQDPRLPDVGPANNTPPVLDSAILTPTADTVLSSLAATTVGGAAYANAGIQSLNVTLDGAAFFSLNPGSAITETSWTQPWTPAAEGFYVFESVVTDSSSRVQTNTRPITVVVDLAAPQATIDRTVFTSTHLAPGSTLVNLTGTATDSLGVGLVEVNPANNGWLPAEFATGVWNINLPFVQGSNQAVQVRVTDRAGKVTIINPTITVDTLAPDLDLTAITLTRNGAPISNTTVISVANPALTINWPTATDASGVRGYYVGWTTTPTPTLSNLTFYANAGAHPQNVGDNQLVYGHVVAVDTLGNQQITSYGPFTIDSAVTPDLIDNLDYVGWHYTGGSQLAADREVSKGPFVGSSFGAVQKFYLSWNDRNLRLSWTGANWANDGDLFIYLDTGAGGATALYNPFGDGTNISLPSGMSANYVIWVQDQRTATLLQGGSWATVATLDATRYLLTSDQGAFATELLLPFTLLGLSNSAALGVLAVASEEGALKLWAAAPDHNPLNSERVINPQAVGRDLNNFALTLYHQWPNLNLGQVPNAGRFADSDLVVTVESLWPSVGAGFLASDLLDLLRFGTPLDTNGDGVLDVALPGSTNVPPVGNGLSVQYRVRYVNNGPATAPNVNVNLTGSGALNVSGGALNLGDVAPGAAGVMTVTASVGSGAYAELLATISDGTHGVYDFWRYHHPADTAAPTALEIEAPTGFVRPGLILISGLVDDASSVPTIAVEVATVPGGVTTLTCPDPTPDDGLWSCLWNTGALAGVDSVALRAQATDGYGNVSGYSPVVTLQVDLTPPSVTLAPASETALADGFINATEAEFTGQVSDNRTAVGLQICDPNSTVGIPVCEERSVLPGDQPVGDWSFRLGSSDEDGVTRTLTFAGIDGAGNSAVVLTRTFRLDVVAPVITPTQVSESDPVLRGLVSDGSGVAAVYVRITPPAGPTVWEAAALQGNRWAYTPTFSLAGGYGLIIEAYDVAGNAAAVGPYGRTITTPSLATITIALDARPKLRTNLGFTGDLGIIILDNPDVDDGDAYTSTRTFTVTPGVYNVRRNNPRTWRTTAISCTPTANGAINLAERLATISVAANESVTCTYVVERGVRIRARAFNDLVRTNANLGRRNAGDPWLANWTMTVYSAPTTTVASTVTTAYGALFEARFDYYLRPGSYTVCPTLPSANWVPTAPATIDPAYGQPCKSVTLQPGQGALLLFGAYDNVVTASELFTPEEEIITDEEQIIDLPEEASEEEEVTERMQSLFLPLVVRE